MTDIVLPGVVWLASDIHLGPSGKATQQAFHEFLKRAGTQADAVLLCGDIFDAWVGDDVALHSPPPWLDETLNILKEVAARTSLWLGRGNRDFLMGTALADHIGARLLDETACLATDYGRILVSHGDEYCTDDLSYQRYKRVVRNSLVQRAFLGLSIPTRRKIAEFARRRSKASYKQKRSRLTDVNKNAIAGAFDDAQVDAMIHGHTHRPAIHQTKLGGRQRTRIVLPDWDFDRLPSRGGWASIDRHGIALHYLGTAEHTPENIPT